jgi:hypothetical protein
MTTLSEALRRAGLVDDAALQRARDAQRLREREAELLRLQREQAADLEDEMLRSDYAATRAAAVDGQPTKA